MAWSDSRINSLNHLDYIFDTCATNISGYATQRSLMMSNATQEKWYDAFANCNQLFIKIYNYMQSWVQNSVGMTYDHDLTNILNLWTQEPGDIEEYELTIGKMMGAMIDSTTDERLHWVLLHDELKRFCFPLRVWHFEIAPPKQ